MTPYELYIKLYNGKLPTERDPNYLELLRMSKFNVVPVPRYKPGKCSNCGSTKEDGRNYIDFGLEIDWYGTVYLCGLCLKEIATKMGLFDELENKIKEAHTERINLYVLNEQCTRLSNEIAHIFEEVKAYFNQLHSVGVHPDITSSSDVVRDEVSTESGIDTTKSGIKEPESGIIKQAPSTGRKNVPSLTSLLDNN